MTESSAKDVQKTDQSSSIKAELRETMSQGQPENLVRALEQFMGSVIGEQLTAMLDGADEILFEMAEKATNGADQRLYFDALRVIRIERARLLRTFQDNLQHAFADGRNERAAASIDLDDVDSWSLQDSEETEEAVTVSNLESKAAAMYQKELYELENRLQTFSENNSEAVSPQIIAPAKIFDAFRHTMKGLEVEFPIKQVIYRLAERSLLGNLGQVYSGANKMLASRGYAPSQRSKAPPQRHAETSNPQSAAQFNHDAGTPSWGNAAPQTGPTAWPSGLSASRLLDGLSAVSGSGSGPQGYTDNQLAGDIGATLDAMAHGRQHNSWVPQANVALSGQMFDSLYQDRQLPEALRPLLRKLQYPVMKTALADPGFFQNSRHPVRNLVHEVFDMLASADSSSENEVKRLSELISYLVQQFEVAPERLSKPEGRAPSVSDEQAEAFLAEQKERQAAQRARTLDKVRRLVSQELKLRTSARAVPEVIMPLLLSGFGPLLAVSVLRGGINGIPWKESIALLERLLSSIEPGQLPGEHQSAEEADIVTSLTERLISIGLPHEKVQKLVAALLEIYQTQALEQAVQPIVGMTTATSTSPRPIPPPPQQISPEAQALATAQQALSVILTVGSWFQVWDALNDQRRWLKLHTYTATRDTVVFNDFMDENHLKLAASNLIRDLIKGLTVPVDPTPAVQRSIKLLAPLADLLPVSTEAASWQSAASSTKA